MKMMKKKLVRVVALEARLVPAEDPVPMSLA